MPFIYTPSTPVVVSNGLFSEIVMSNEREFCIERRASKYSALLHTLDSRDGVKMSSFVCSESVHVTYQIKGKEM